jgi:hypothetical protein
MSGRPARAAFAAIVALVGLAGSLDVVAAAGPNELSNGWVSPTTGTTSTAFTFSVDYRSDKDFGASSVVAMVAGRSVTLRLASGNASGGTFRGTSTLPAGRWPVSFRAQASQGPSPSLAGPTLVVTAPAPTPPPPTPKPTPPPPPPPTPAPALATNPPAPTRSTVTTPSPTDATVAPSTPNAATSSETPSPTNGIVGGTDVGDRPGERDDNPTGMLLGLGALSMAGLASGAIVVARRRRPQEEAPDGGGEPIPLMSAAHPSLPAGSHNVEDPILAAMGLGTTHQPDPNAPITRSVHFGPGERPTPPKYRGH